MTMLIPCQVTENPLCCQSAIALANIQLPIAGTKNGNYEVNITITSLTPSNTIESIKAFS